MEMSTPVERNPSITVIREVYEGINALELFEHQLDEALENGYDIIIVEPNRLGDETARWISIGNCLHKTATLSGLGSFASALIWTDKPYLCTSMCVVSLLCTCIYTVSWQFDPCVNYQVQNNIKRLISNNYPPVESSSVVLVRKEASRRNMLHSGVSLLATVVCMWRLYEALK